MEPSIILRGLVIFVAIIAYYKDRLVANIIAIEHLKLNSSYGKLKSSTWIGLGWGYSGQ